MNQKTKTRQLALCVAVALSAGGGVYLLNVPYTYAADVVGHNVLVNNPADPKLLAPGISGGEINAQSDAGNVRNNTLTMDGVSYLTGSVYGGVTFGTGRAEGNHLVLKNGTVVNVYAAGGRTFGGNAINNKVTISGAATSASLIYAAGGVTDGASGDVASNKAVMQSGTASNLYGGFVLGPNSKGSATGNEVTLSGGTVGHDVAGGIIQGPSATSQGTGNVTGNKVNITGGTVNGVTYGGLARGIGAATTNKVTVSGVATALKDVKGGQTSTGKASSNEVDFKEASADNLIGGRVSGTNAAGDAAGNKVTLRSGTIAYDVRGGDIVAPTAAGSVADNSVTINNGSVGRAVTGGYNMGRGSTERNIVNIAGGSITDVVTGGHGTGAGKVSGNRVSVTGGTLADEIRGGYAANAGEASDNHVSITGGTVNSPEIYGGRSVNGKAIGNTATIGTITVSGDVIGGRGKGAEGNKVFLRNNAMVNGDAIAGLTPTAGNAVNNILTIEQTGATVGGGAAVGGQTRGAAGDVTGNQAIMQNGMADQLIGGMIAGIGAAGKAEGNRAEVSGGTVTTAVIGAQIEDTAATGAVKDNHAVVKTQTAGFFGDIIGGQTKGTGAVTGNSATVSGSSVTSGTVIGGMSHTGSAESNTVSFKEAHASRIAGAWIDGTNAAGNAIKNEVTIESGSVNTGASGAAIAQGSTSGKVQENTLTIKGGTIHGNSVGGETAGSGSAVSNKVIVSGTATQLDDVIGGSSARGSATANKVTFQQATAASLTGGLVTGLSTGSVTGNTVDMTSGTVTAGVFGGGAGAGVTVEKNIVTVAGGSASGSIIGGRNSGTGAVSSNEVKLTGGNIHANVFGGQAGGGAATGNIVTVSRNVTGSITGGVSANGVAHNNSVDIGAVTVTGNVTGGQGAASNNNKVSLTGSTVTGTVTGGTAASGTGNILTVKGNNRTGNVAGFQKLVFDVAAPINMANPLLKATGSAASSDINWRTIEMKGTVPTSWLNRSITLMENMNGIAFTPSGSYNGKRVTITAGKFEGILDTDTHSGVGVRKIEYTSYQFKDAVVTGAASGTDTWAGRSIAGNSTVNNRLTITGGSTTNAYGGWTAGTGTTAPAAQQNNTKDNTATLNAGTITNLYGGYTDAAAGKATGNKVFVNGGSVTANVTGGFGGTDATDNHVTVTGGSVGGTIRGAQSAGTAHKNTVEIKGGNVHAGILGADAAGAATENKVTTTGTVTGNITGAKSTSGAVTKNVVTIKGNVTGNVTGGQTTGAANANTVDLGAVTINGSVTGGAGSTTSNNKVNMSGTTVSGVVTGGAGSGTGNALTVKGNNRAGNIAGFQKLTFNLGNLNRTNPMLRLTSGTATNITFGSIAFEGTPEPKVGQITLVEKSAPSIHVADYAGVRGRTEGDFEYDLDTDTQTANAKKILFDGYRFRNAVVTGAASGTDTWAGRSRIGNSTVNNRLTITGGSTTNAYGGWTAGTGTTAPAAQQNDTTGNTVTLKAGTVTNLYGGYTTSPNGKATGNTANVNGGAATNVIGGYTAAPTGRATGNIVNINAGNVGHVTGGFGAAQANANIVTVKANVTGSVVGGKSVTGTASGNILTLSAVHIGGSITGGQGAVTKDNEINLSGTRVAGVVTGGTAGSVGNKLRVLKKGAAAQSLRNFDQVSFTVGSNLANGDTMLTLRGNTNLSYSAIVKPTGAVAGTWLGSSMEKNAHLIRMNGGTLGLTGYTHAVSVQRTGDVEYAVKTDNDAAITAGSLDLSAYRWQNANVTVNTRVTNAFGGKTVITNGSTKNNTLKLAAGANVQTAVGSDTQSMGGSASKGVVTVVQGAAAHHIIGGRSAGGAASENSVTVSGGSVNGSIKGAQAAGKAEKNTVLLSGGTIHANVTGAQAGTGAAENTVTVQTNVTGNVTGAQTTSGTASKNTIDLGNITVTGNVTGGRGTTTNNNTIHLSKTTVGGTITGGTAAGGTGNTLVVHPGASKARSLAGIQNVHFYLDQTVDKAHPILSLTTTHQDLRGVKVGVGVIDGTVPVLRVNDKLSLIKVAPGGTLRTDPAMSNTTTGMQGVSLHYDFTLAQTTPGELSATVTKAMLNEQTKSFAETRAGVSDFINHGADTLAAAGMNAAKVEAGKGRGYALWAMTDKSGMKAKTGSYVDTNGWNLGLGWANQQKTKAGTWTFGPFVEYGHGSYSSYLNDGTHGRGKISYLGGGIMANYTQKNGVWVEGFLHGGRAKSDYSGSVYTGTVSTYDGSSSYYAAHLGVGKETRVHRKDTLNTYLRYFYSHQAGMHATLNTGEDYTFDSVNSHRLRLGMRYSHKDSAYSQVYAGLAFEYEFDGEARASFQGYNTPSPSLKGASGMLELGYRFIPKNGRVSYELNLTGWQGRREGISGGAQVKWMF